MITRHKPHVGATNLPFRPKSAPEPAPYRIKSQRCGRHTDYRFSARPSPDTPEILMLSLIELRADYAAWLDALPESLRGTATAEALQAIVELDLETLAAIEPPRGYGRD